MREQRTAKLFDRHNWTQEKIKKKNLFSKFHILRMKKYAWVSKLSILQMKKFAWHEWNDSTTQNSVQYSTIVCTMFLIWMYFNFLRWNWQLCDNEIFIMTYILQIVLDLWSCFNERYRLSGYRDTHYKGKTVLQPSHLYYENPYSSKTAFIYIEKVPCWLACLGGIYFWQVTNLWGDLSAPNTLTESALLNVTNVSMTTTQKTAKPASKGYHFKQSMPIAWQKT